MFLSLFSCLLFSGLAEAADGEEIKTWRLTVLGQPVSYQGKIEAEVNKANAIIVEHAQRILNQRPDDSLENIEQSLHKQRVEWSQGKLNTFPDNIYNAIQEEFNGLAASISMKKALSDLNKLSDTEISQLNPEKHPNMVAVRVAFADLSIEDEQLALFNEQTIRVIANVMTDSMEFARRRNRAGKKSPDPTNEKQIADAIDKLKGMTLQEIRADYCAVAIQKPSYCQK